jgi:hypothetical protein
MKKLFLLAAMLIFTACASNDYEEEYTPNELEQEQEWEMDWLEDLFGAAEEPPPFELPTRNPRREQMIEDRVIVATVNGRPITAGDVSFGLSNAAFLMQSGHVENILEEAVTGAAFYAIIMQYAEDHGIYLSEDDKTALRAELDEIEAVWAGSEEFDFYDVLLLDGIYSREHLEEIFFMFEIMDRTIEAIFYSDEKFAAFLDFYEYEEILAAKHILISLDDFETDDDALAFAYEIWERATAGEDFDTLVATYGQDPGMVQSPEGYTFTQNMMAFEFEQGTRELAIGDISYPIFTAFGIHIILRIEPDMDNIIRPPWGAPTPDQRRESAIYAAFHRWTSDADIVFLPELQDIPVE